MRIERAAGANPGDRTYNGATAAALEAPRGNFVLRAAQAAKEFLLGEGTDLKYGARHAKRAIVWRLLYPPASLLETDQTTTGGNDPG
jgi:hypothetical protein